ncbi:MAG: hypothetical protein K0U38_10560 [Epsilonproteobacteria bacterium]|nr:hypothetical protein [Campylobacterota bacterium]
MFEIASQIVLCLLLAALLGAIIGYILGKSSCSSDEECHEAPEATHELHIDNQSNNAEVAALASTDTEEVQNLGVEPELLTAPREGGKDNLQLIKGIGEVIEKVLNDKGVYHFDQIANWSKEEITWIDRAISFPGRAERENWMEQAKELGKGKTTEFSERVEKGEVSTSKKS